MEAMPKKLENIEEKSNELSSFDVNIVWCYLFFFGCVQQGVQILQFNRIITI